MAQPIGLRCTNCGQEDWLLIAATPITSIYRCNFCYHMLHLIEHPTEPAPTEPDVQVERVSEWQLNLIDTSVLAQFRDDDIAPETFDAIDQYMRGKA